MKKITILIVLAIIVFCNFTAEAELSERKIIKIGKPDNGQQTVSVLEGVYWIRLYDSNKYKSAIAGNDVISDFNLTPLLPAKRLNEIDKQRKLKTCGLLSVKEASDFVTADKISRTFTAEYSGNLKPSECMAMLKKNYPEIEFVEPYYVSDLQRSPEYPDDLRLPEQYTYTKMQVQNAWSAGLVGSPEITIAISDCGVMRQHEDLSASLAYNTKEIPNNGIDDDGNGYIDDYAGYNFSYKSDKTAADSVEHSASHGTNVAGICSATADNGKGIAGTGNKCRFFPIKVCMNNSTSVIFGYNSIIYAAENKIPVINCSWGRSKPYSQVEQDIVDYALSQGVSIVAASGNVDYENASEVFYPANYRGVLGVGETDNYDRVSSSSSVSLQTDIMAIGAGDLTCSNSSTSSYGYTGGGTSFASPVVAGFVGLIRAKYPELSAFATSEFARKCTDDIRDININDTQYTGFLPGRVNFMKALENKPETTIACSFVKVEYFDSVGAKISRIRDYSGEVTANVTAGNNLATIDNATFRISYLNVFNTNDFNITNAEAVAKNIATNAEFDINGFRFVSNGEHPDFAAFRIEVVKNGEIVDFFTFPIVNNNDITTFQNDSIVFSVSDYGKFGSSINEDLNYGSGFAPRSSLNLLSTESSIALTIDNNYVFSGIYGDYYKYSDFKPVKNFTGTDSSTGIVNVVNQAGFDMNITAKYRFPSQNLPLIRVDLTLTNNGTVVINRPSLGMIFDWDIIPKVLENHSGYLFEALPDKADPVSVSAQYITNFDSSEYVGTLVMSQSDQSVIAQSGATTSLSSNDDIMTLLNSASNAQTPETGDIITGTGMKFSNQLAQNDTRSLIIFIGYARSKQELAALLKDAASTAGVDAGEATFSTTILYPNPADNMLKILSLQPVSYIEIIAENGLPVLKNYNCSGSCETDISVENLPAGVYFVRSDNQFSGKFIKK